MYFLGILHQSAAYDRDKLERGRVLGLIENQEAYISEDKEILLEKELGIVERTSE